MEEKRYIISEVAERTGIETHVLRYWEDELNLDIPRNKMGHRYYTEEQVELFKQIKELKDSGFQLKAVKAVLDGQMQGAAVMQYVGNEAADKNVQAAGNGTADKNVQAACNGTAGDNVRCVCNGTADNNVQAACNGAVDNNVPAAQGEAHMESAGTSEVAALTQEEIVMKRSEDKLAQFEQIIGDIVTRSLLENNVALGENISAAVSERVCDKVIKEMDYMMRVREEAEDDRFRRLDETIRGVQKSNKEAAAYRERGDKSKKRHGLFKKVK
jgi:DNA-binding transcriptional MerR regulator